MDRSAYQLCRLPLKIYQRRDAMVSSCQWSQGGECDRDGEVAEDAHGRAAPFGW